MTVAKSISAVRPLPSSKEISGSMLPICSPIFRQNPEELERVNTEVHYLGYYLKWHPQGAYYYSQEHGGFQAAPERTPRDLFENTMASMTRSMTFTSIRRSPNLASAARRMMRPRKSGTVKSTAKKALRLSAGSTANSRKDLPRKFSSIFPSARRNSPPPQRPSTIPGMDRAYFAELEDRFRSPHLWTRKNGDWTLKHAVWHD